ncbi:divergent polysaccharide deacetylase family protein [Rhizobium sp. BK251]|uniref:divergent polysaccharide deacetylase family protein n=1 Tax=Rhizobium sp. BK251 TaxID=2512125 RepID=UPI001044F4FD|nr:divergent polysaccharide deacetylase family protein [Rhizobium sp. BK251]TCL73034.1 hypothetical protein EV286_104466 [Rhizobium sp. BK251]
MRTDLHAPLGQNRGPRSAGLRIFRLSRVIASLCLIAIGAFSLYTAFAPGTPERATPTAPSEGLPTPPATAETQTKPAIPTAGPTLADARSGANVERTELEDGSVVTKFSPRPRAGGGPVVIDAREVGQDPRMAAVPDASLLEESPYGSLPVVGPDGRRPMDRYARPWSGARGTRIAIVVSGLGLSQTGTQRAIKQLPEEITLAFASSGNSLQRWMQEARRAGHEILLQVPLEPFDYPDNNPGPETLLTSAAPAANLENLHKAMGRITNYTGIMNYMGGRLLSDVDKLEPVMRDVGKRGLLFLDDGSSAQSQSATLAKAVDTPHASADVRLDGQLDVDAIMKKLDELERIARRNGQAIGVASAFDESLDAINEWSEEARLRGIEIVAVSALAEDPQRP